MTLNESHIVDKFATLDEKTLAKMESDAKELGCKSVLKIIKTVKNATRKGSEG